MCFVVVDVTHVSAVVVVAPSTTTGHTCQDQQHIKHPATPKLDVASSSAGR